MKLGTTLNDPLTYFAQQVRADDKANHLFRDTSLATGDAKSTFVFITRFSLMHKHQIAVRFSTYRLDTNGTFTNITSRLKWSILD